MFKNIFKKNLVEIEPEEILLDRESTTKLETPVNKKGVVILFAVTIIIFSLFFIRAFWLQIWQGNYYSVRANENSVQSYPSRAPRGIIYDRNGKALTLNISNFNLLAIPADIPEEKVALNNWVSQVSEILEKSETDIFNFLKNLNKNSTELVLLEPDLKQSTLIELEARLLNLPGLFVNKETKRDYYEGEYFSHLIGYTRNVSPSDLQTDSYYSMLDLIGKDGLESQYEKDLRGTPGKIAISVNSDNTVLKTLIAEDARQGNNLILSIDSELQKLLIDSLRDKMAQTDSPGAAAVVLDVKSGEILSLVSLPSFDNNIFNTGLISKIYQKLINDKNRPFFNRAISGFYPAGSTIKPFIASAALVEKTIDPNYKVDDTLGYISIPNEYNPEITYIYRDWRPHGFIDMREALAVSANVYFYTIGGGYKNIKGLGINKIEKYLKLFGFGAPLGMDLPGEAGGLVPSPDWKMKTRQESWFTGDTYNVSIGQGDVKITPLQLATAMAAIANGGTLWQPKLVSKITDSNNNTVKEINSKALKTELIGQDNLKIVREGLRMAVTEVDGSSFFLKDLPIKVAGKTGTAQVYSDFSKINALFAGFAPYDDPQIALAIVIEGSGQGITSALPAAKDVFEWYYNKNYDKLK